MVIAFLAATFLIIKVIIIIAAGRDAAVVIIGIVAAEFIAGTVGCICNEAGGCELGERGVVKPSPSPP